MVKINPQYSPTGTNSMLSFFTGALDLAYMGSSPLVLGRLFNLPIKIVAIANKHKGSIGVIKNKISNNKGTKKLGTVFGSDGHVISHHFKRNTDIDIVLVNLSPMECMEAMEIGMIDYAALWEPYLSILTNKNHRLVFCDDDLQFSMYSFIVATQNSLSKKGAAISDFIDVHNETIELIDRAKLPSYIPSLRYIFGSELKEDIYQGIMLDGYEWPASNIIKDARLPDDVEYSLKQIALTHRELKNGVGMSFDVRQLIPASDSVESDDNYLDVGYSNSIMCTTFHLADLAGLFIKHDMPLLLSNRRTEERIARLNEKYRDDMKLCFELIARDPELVIQKLGRLNESLFQEIERAFYGDNKKTLAASIERIRENELIPREILSWADTIRSIRNVATHSENAISVDEAKNVFNIFLNILEWVEKNESIILSKNLCARCSKVLNSEWQVCPYCGYTNPSSCPNCGSKIQTEWKLCPYCSEKLNLR